MNVKNHRPQTEAEKHQCIPVHTLSTDKVIKNGWGGTKPLPVTTTPFGIAVTFIVPKHALKKLKRTQGLTLVLLDNGELSMVVADVKVVSES